ncbi:DNA polymerase III subunit gamma/tau [Gammaproteobacteria bacterium]|nr:DNA polymerase III subunit gamma/tau [Gammaproteobacteria bacterium]
MSDAKLATDTEDSNYKVLARKYRPSDFNALIGQDPMVRTLKNAFESGRLAHAFILTGVRGVGKTTTARIIARALNCVGIDGSGDATIEPCGICEPCQAITEGRLVDVLEMDAASRTGVDDVRELIEGVRYKPVSARYKVYIIDEVHMLSRNAFNALLKTLEEPPAHVKFIFATTEIRKVPVTVLSRCQRFDLRRVDIETLSANFKWIAEVEGVTITDAAIALIARAADGSVRDGQSLLDQVFATGIKDTQELNEVSVRQILGLVSRENSFDLFELVMSGNIADALEQLDNDYGNGADPLLILQDLLDVVHWLARIKVTPQIADGSSVPELDAKRGKGITAQTSMAVLTRAWQMLLKGLSEAQISSSPIQAAEMILIRLAYLADLPTPVDAIKAMNTRTNQETSESSSGSIKHSGNSPIGKMQSMTNLKVMPNSYTEPNEDIITDLKTFDDVVTLADKMNERILRTNLINNVHLVRFKPGAIVFQPGENMPREFVQELTRFLNEATDRRWVITVSLDEQGAETYQQREDAAEAARLLEITATPFVQSVLEVFPGAEIDAVRDIGDLSDFIDIVEINNKDNT